MNQYEALFKWNILQVQLQNKFQKNNQRKTKIYRGSIYTCLLGINIGNEKSRLTARPVLVISADTINLNSTNVVVVPLSTDIKYRSEDSNNLLYPWHYVLTKANYPQLEKSSAVQCEDVRSVSKIRLGELITKVSAKDMSEIEKRMKKTMDMYTG